MVTTQVIRIVCLSILAISLRSPAMNVGMLKKKEVIVGQAHVDGKKYEYYLVVNRKEKKGIHVINRTDRPILLLSGDRQKTIYQNDISSAADKEYTWLFKSGQKLTFAFDTKKSKHEQIIGSLDADFMLAGGNFTIMRRLVHKDEL